MQVSSRVFSGLRSGLVLVLLLAAVAELGATIAALRASDPPQALAGLSLPGSFVTLTLAVVLSALSPPGRVLRAVVAVFAVAFAGVRLGVAGSLVVAESDVSGFMLGFIPGRLGNTSVGAAVFTGAVLGLTLAAWACMEVIRPVRSGLRAPTTGTVSATSGARGAHGAGTSTSHPSQWRRATTPWPRAVEDDPGGTLIRPRVRR